MFTNGSCVGNIVLQQIVREKGNYDVLIRPDLKIALGLTNLSTIAHTPRQFIKQHGIHFTV